MTGSSAEELEGMRQCTSLTQTMAIVMVLVLLLM